MTLIGLGGKKRAGKDAVAEILKRRFGFTVLGMSDALHEAMVTLNPWVFIPHDYRVRVSDGGLLGSRMIRYALLADLVDYDEMKTIPEVRRLLQVFGTEVGRNLLGEDVWVDVMKRKIVDIGAGRHPLNIAVTGIRFENELEMIEDLGGTSIYVRRPEAVIAASTDTHSSEHSLLPRDFDHVLDNDGTLSDLEAMVIEHIFEWHGIEPLASPTSSNAAGPRNNTHG